MQIAVFFVVVLTILNLRGVTESASILAYPVYLFVLALFILIGAGIYQLFTGQITPNIHAPIGTPIAGITLFLLLRAFASGCSALTGVEAISNAIPNFKDPAPNNAAKTLTIMGGLLAVLFSGIVYLAYNYGISPSAEVTVVSQIAEETFGRNFMYYFIQGTTALILILAANTGYSAFPLLAVNLAKDKFIPRMFLARGDRLGYSNGIIILGALSIILIFVFHAKTEHLIPLYAVGVFIPFTLSQTGMIAKWLREKPKGWFTKLIINAIGALISFVVTIMFFLTKFDQVWSVFVFLPLIIFAFHKVRKHYKDVGDQLRVLPSDKPNAIKGNVFIVPVSGITHVVENSINYVKALSPEQILAVYISFDRDSEKEFEEKWKKWQPDIKLVTFHSQYRSIINPLTKFIDRVEYIARDENYQVTVVIPQFIPKKGWHNILHNHSGTLIRSSLLFRRNVVVTTVPFHLKK